MVSADGVTGARPSAFARSRRVLLAVAAFAAYESILLAAPWDRYGMTAFRDAAVAVVATLSAVACIRRSRLEDGRVRTAWRMLAGASVVFTLAVLHAGYEAVAIRPVGFRDSDLRRRLFEASIVLTWIGLLMLAGRSRFPSRVLVALDALIITASCVFIGWVIAVRRVYESTALPPASRYSAVFLLVGTIVDVALVLILAVRWQGNGRTLALLAGAYAFLTYNAFLFALVSLTGRLRIGAPYDFALFVGYLLLTFAAADRSAARQDASALRRQWRLALGVPYICALVVTGTAASLLVTGSRVGTFLTALIVLLVVLVLARLFLTLLENRRIALELEARVAERTAQLQHSHERFRSLVQNSSDVIAVVDAAGAISYISPAVQGMLGFAEAELAGSAMLDLVHPSDADAAARSLQAMLAGGKPAGTLSARLRRRDESYCQAEAMLTPLDEGGTRSVVLNIRDVSERAVFEQQLRHQALHDVLTSLANRRLFNERVRHALDRAQRTGEDIAILFIDLDNFKRLNDSAGHGAGDELLVAVASRLSAALRPSDTAARLGGDEFGVLLEATRIDEAQAVAQRMLAALGLEHAIGERRFVLGASVGVAGCRAGSLDYDTLLRNADLAMYQAKATGRGRCVVFDPDMHARLLSQVELEAGLRQAITDSGLEVHYQPILNLLTGQIYGVEALTRWFRPEHGAVPPSLFIPLAEDSDLIQALDTWVLGQVCTQVREWQLRYPRHASLTANINFSALELRDGGYADAVTAALQRSGLAPGDVVLEVTETAVLPERASLLEQLTEIRRLGVRISLDDFGTGYSSLASLRNLPLDEIKIDGSFVEGLHDGRRGRGIVKAIVELAEALEVHTVAECIESAEQLTALRALRCVSGQGYLFAAPLPAKRFEELLEGGVVVDTAAVIA